MSTDKTPRDADETLALPVPDHEPAPQTPPADTAVISTDAADTVVDTTDETTALVAADPVARASDDTATLASGDTAARGSDEDPWPASDADAEPLSGGNGKDADETAVLVPDETRALPLTEETGAYPSTSSRAEPAGYTSPIGALYAPTDRPDQAPSDRVVEDPAVTRSPVTEVALVDPPRRRLRVGTVVWGLVIAAIGVGLLAWAAGFAIDLQLAMIVLLAVAGTALLVGSIISGARASRR